MTGSGSVVARGWGHALLRGAGRRRFGAFLSAGILLAVSAFLSPASAAVTCDDAWTRGTLDASGGWTAGTGNDYRVSCTGDTDGDRLTAADGPELPAGADTLAIDVFDTDADRLVTRSGAAMPRHVVLTDSLDPDGGNVVDTLIRTYPVGSEAAHGMVEPFATIAASGRGNGGIQFINADVNHTGTTGDLFRCGSHNNLEGYNELHELIKTNPDNIGLFHSLAITSLCLNKKDEGLAHLQTASDKGHIVATLLLGSYYEHNRTFDSSEYFSNIQDLNNAIHYYRKASDLIVADSNYPEGTTDDMPYIESVSFTSYQVFRGLPGLYTSGYLTALEDTENGGEVTYSDTLAVLHNVNKTASLCVKRPALYVGTDKEIEFIKPSKLHVQLL